MTGPFEPEMIANLPQMTIQQLSKLEDCISDEFALLAREYVQARKSRVEYMQKNIESQIRTFQQNDTSWSSFYNQQVKLIDTLTNLTENNVIGDNTSSCHQKIDDTVLEIETQLKQLTASIELPLDLDVVFKHELGDLPFAEYFKEIVDLHKAQLVALLHHIQYQSDLTESITEKNRVIFWKQYKADVLQYKEKLINQTCQELENLHKEYHGISSEANEANTNSHYYRSVVPVEMSKADARCNTQYLLSTKNLDKYHGFDNIYFRNHRIEITDTKKAVQRRFQEFLDQQNQYKIAQLDSVAVKLAGCMGLSKEEAENDLALMRRRDGSTIDEQIHLGEVMCDDDLDFSSFSQEETYDSDVEDYHSILDMNRPPIRIDATTP
ncbi:hypothetical protein METBIDRAFT_45324 [Metschnikowia bicuspidata var. bicuspidata NRRL YB-4993]|uniref:Uncharacterized protein n=1 Tax=Metschnikowia bicuspidata var. bicuspidata NRRL YB-4993 TaxID=869754 RepID=A0A1A0H885_9ASCO|nr:hypothetical protein METBIDRAFT_45324 [Metschnikowia bicuspidata var. bicuspidata NRRL YB-4993]OBA20102.1 hypothetical protein METBIDRAFT_45324 [Metschnikowia bicuspidata var. bicuspidata NRRL YB-4993]